MRNAQEPIEPKFRPGKHIPRWFKWRRKTCEVIKRVESWVKETDWWNPKGPECRQYYRVVVRGQYPTNVWSRFTCTLCKRVQAEEERWLLASVDD